MYVVVGTHKYFLFFIFSRQTKFSWSPRTYYYNIIRHTAYGLNIGNTHFKQKNIVNTENLPFY